MIRTGTFRFIRHAALEAAMARGWLVVDMMADCHHGEWSAICWHCLCGQVQP